MKCNTCIHKECFLRLCDDASLELLDASKTTTNYKRGQFIFQEGNPVHGIYIVHMGKVKVMNSGYNEKNQCVRLANSGHILGHRGYGGKYYTVSALTLEDSTICFIEKELFDKVLKTNSNLTYNLMMFYAEELRIAESRIRNLAQMSVKEKVAEALLLLMRTFGVASDKGVLLDVLLTRQDLADIAGTRVEQVIRTLTDLRRTGWIELQGKRIRLTNPQALLDLLSDYNMKDDFAIPQLKPHSA